MAIFVITVMTLLAAGLMRSLNQETVNVGIETFSTRAWATAQTGLDWGLARALNQGPGQCDTAPLSLRSLNALPADSEGFAGCDVRVTCTHTAYCEHSGGCPPMAATNRYLVAAEATCGAGNFEVTRSMEALAYD